MLVFVKDDDTRGYRRLRLPENDVTRQAITEGGATPTGRSKHVPKLHTRLYEVEYTCKGKVRRVWLAHSSAKEMGLVAADE